MIMEVCYRDIGCIFLGDWKDLYDIIQKLSI